MGGCRYYLLKPFNWKLWSQRMFSNHWITLANIFNMERGPDESEEKWLIRRWEVGQPLISLISHHIARHSCWRISLNQIGSHLVKTEATTGQDSVQVMVITLIKTSSLSLSSFFSLPQNYRVRVETKNHHASLPILGTHRPVLAVRVNDEVRLQLSGNWWW